MNEDTFIQTLKVLLDPPVSSATELLSHISKSLKGLCGADLISVWAEVAGASDSETHYVRTYRHDRKPVEEGLPNVLPLLDIQKIESKYHSIPLSIPLHLSPSVTRSLDYIFVVETNLRSEREIRLLELFLQHTLSQHFSSFQGHIRERVIEATAKSSDLGSFLHKIINRILIEWFDVEAATFFYYDKTTDSLVQATSTGITFQAKNRLKRSDIRYFMDSNSHTVRCFVDGQRRIEIADNGDTLRENTYGEDVSKVYSRAYFPLKILSREGLDDDITNSIGVVRLVNMNKSIGGRYIHSIQSHLLDFLFEMTTILAKRYIRVHSILHDQERATHGYATDLLTISFASRTIQLWLDSDARNDRTDINKHEMHREISNRVRSIVSIQENMSHQLATVSRHSANSYFDVPEDEKRYCNHPFKDVFLRIMDAKRGISSCYNRQELLILSDGVREFSDEFMKMPSIKMSVGEMYMVVRNIVENAIKYTHKSERPRLDITWTVDNENVTYRFRDFGIGVPEKERQLLGRESFRGYEARRIQLRGNGLGLAVSRDVLAKREGSLTYEAPNDGEKGSVFVLRVRKG